MKRICCFFLCVGLVLSVSAQRKRHNRIPANRYHVIAGLNSGTFSIKENGGIDEVDRLTRYHAGFLATVPLSRSWAFQPGAVFANRGAKTELYLSNNVTTDNYYKLKTRVHYIEVPLNILFRRQVNPGVALFIGAGPYMAVAVGGTNGGERRVSGNSSHFEQGIEFTNRFTGEDLYQPVSTMERFDYGANAVAGAELKRFMLRFQYGYGLADVFADEAVDMKNRFFSMSLGFRL